jgi:hypothetical protein
MTQPDSKSTTLSDADAQLILEEYEALRDEILQRAESQTHTMLLTIAALGALLSRNLGAR